MKKIFFILALAALAVYFNALNNDFVWDDRFLIENNDLIKDPRRIPSIFTTDLYHSHAEKTGAPHSNFYRPIQTLSFMVDYHIWGPSPFGFHLGNLLLHIINGILVSIAVFLICKCRLTSLFYRHFVFGSPRPDGRRFLYKRAGGPFGLFFYPAIFYFLCRF